MPLKCSVEGKNKALQWLLFKPIWGTETLLDRCKGDIELDMNISVKSLSMYCAAYHEAMTPQKEPVVVKGRKFRNEEKQE